MRHVCVLADGAQRPRSLFPNEEIIELNTTPPRFNVRLQIDTFPQKFLSYLPDRSDDLLRIAAFIYAADTAVRRGTVNDVYASDWQRSFRLCLPVTDIDFWGEIATKQHLIETLNFLTGDEFSFEFTKRLSVPPIQGLLPYDKLPHPLPQVKSVILFSGGADSLAATIEALNEGLKPLLVSHRPAPAIDKRQKNLVSEIQKKWPRWTFPHVSMWVNRAGGKRPVEFTQRSRSFLFTSLGVTSASLLGVQEIRLCDNGIVSINLPRSGQNIGTTLSRSTHPRYIELCNELMQRITNNSSLRIKNTLLFKTKKEIFEIIKNSGHPELLQETVSCVHTRDRTKLHSHCGVCTQCIDRRFASIAADMTDFDMKEKYKHDVFLSSLETGEGRTHAENYVRFALELEKMDTPDKFFENYSELFECIPPDENADKIGTGLWDLFQRFQQQVNGVVVKTIIEHANDILRGTLDKNSLLYIINSAQHVADLRERYAHRLRTLLCDSLPLYFQTEKARNERHVQDAGEATFKAAQTKFDREAPQVPFGVVTAKPDFSSTKVDEKDALYIEFKYVKDRKGLNRIVTEITSRITIYRDQGACALFIVYDPTRGIRDDRLFVEPLEKHEGIWVGISR